MTLSDDDLPPLYQAADKSSIEAQLRFLLTTRVRLSCLIGAALFGLFCWKHGLSSIDWAGVIAASFFLFALVVEGFLYRDKPQRTWYEGRATAESVKTLSWRYGVGGEPFNLGIETEAHIAELFLTRLQSLFEVVKNLDLATPTSSESQITPRMREIRALSLAERKDIYERGRVVDQQTWYQTKANWNRRFARRWTRFMLFVEILGVTFGILKAVGSIEGDLLTFSSVVLAAATAWMQTKQYRMLATAYTVTALELASVRSKIANQCSEAEWAKFVNDAEEAFSREHTLWQASRAMPSAD